MTHAFPTDTGDRMPPRAHVLIVDDSAIIRGLIARALEVDPRIYVAGTAANGEMAIAMARQLQPHVVLLDIEMPVMDGITALPHIRAALPAASHIVMVSTLTRRGAEIAMQALALGATDYLAKPESRQNGGQLDAFYQSLRDTVLALAGGPYASASVPQDTAAVHSDQPKIVRSLVAGSGASATMAYVAPAGTPPPVQGSAAVIQPVTANSLPVLRHAPRALAIGASTGGPQALSTLLTGLRGALLNMPIFITQHMPPTFTALLAQRLTEVAQRPCAEAQQGEEVQGGHIYVAPGDYHLGVLTDATGRVRIQLNQNPPENYCRPAVDPMLRSLSTCYGERLLAVILTGMGQDGLAGCQRTRAEGGLVLAQDEATSVVWGMPGAVVKAGLSAAALPLADIAPALVRLCKGGHP